MLHTLVEQSRATKTSAKVALGESRKTPATGFDTAYRKWQAGQMLLRKVNESPDIATDDWVDENTDRATAKMDPAAKRMSSIAAQNLLELARKLEMIVEEIDHSGGNVAAPYDALARSAYSDAFRLAKADTELPSTITDPIFAAIKAWQEATRAHDQELKKNGWEKNAEKTCAAYHRTALKMACTVPTTKAGAAELTKWLLRDIGMGESPWQMHALQSISKYLRG